MRYIAKGATPAAIPNYIAAQRRAGLVYDYEGFPDKPALNDILRTEQRSICCYCQQLIDHYNGKNIAGSHNEHQIPQNGPHGNRALELEYENIYACCNYTKDYASKEDKYCGWHKEDNLITPFIQDTECRNYFKYNTIGEILPNGIYDTEEEYEAHKEELPQRLKDALETIEVLNLNQIILKENRKNVVDGWISILSQRRLTKAQATVKIQQITNRRPLPPFAEALIYYLNQIN